MVYTIKPLGPEHDRGAFHCGNDHIDAFCREAMSDHEAFKKRIYVACEDGSNVVVGYYCLSLSTIGSGKAKKYSDPAIYLDMIGVTVEHQKRQLGQDLMRDAITNVYKVAQLAGAIWLWLTAVDKETAEFYLKLGFNWLNEDRLTLFIPIEDIVAIVEAP